MFCELLKFSNYQKHTMYWIPLLGHPVGRHVRLKQQIIKRSYTYMHLTHNKTYLCRVFSKISFDPLRLCFANESRCLFPKELWISIGSSMNPQIIFTSFLSYSHIHLPTWIYPQISSKISDTLWYLWLARSTAVSHPFPFGPSMVGSRPPFSVQTCESHSPISSVAESSQHSCDHPSRSAFSGESVWTMVDGLNQATDFRIISEDDTLSTNHLPTLKELTILMQPVSK